MDTATVALASEYIPCFCQSFFTPRKNKSKQSQAFLVRSVPGLRERGPFIGGGRPALFLFWSIKMPGGVTVKDVDPHQLVKAMAAFLKKSGKLKVPDWVDLVKTAKRKELAPYDPDWYYIRAASILRHIYLRNGVGVGALTKVYGGRKRRGARPCHFEKGSSSIARFILKSLEQLKLVETVSSGGRAITSQGRRDMDRIAGQVLAE